jgi:hypothetical protein
MPQVNITRGASAPRKTRGQISAGVVFQTFLRNGVLGRKQYAAIGENGRSYSVNIATKELAGTAKKDRQVQIVGKWEMKSTLNVALRAGPNVITLPGGVKANVVRRCARSAVKGNELFVATDTTPTSVYAHVGVRKDGKLLSLNTSNGNHAITNKLSREVAVVGTYQMDVQLAS